MHDHLTQCLNFHIIIIKNKGFIWFHFIFDNQSRETIQDAKTAWVAFDEGRNLMAKSGWDQLKTHPTYNICSRGGGVIDEHYASLTSLEGQRPSATLTFKGT